MSIRLGVGSGNERISRADGDSGGLEAQMTEIAVEVVLAAEVQHREGATRQYRWRQERKAALEGEERKRLIEAERAERERQRRFEQARLDRLLRDASAFRQAADIRRYVERLRRAQSCESTVSVSDFERWSNWALAQADRIDPGVGGIFLKAMKDESEA